MLCKPIVVLAIALALGSSALSTSAFARDGRGAFGGRAFGGSQFGRCFDGGPNVSTMMRLEVSSRSMVCARAIAVAPPAPCIAASSFGA